jgi:hypothetical protein
MDDDKILLGETRREAINRLQERLGPMTLRHLAEKTFWELAKKGIITKNQDGAYLIKTISNEVPLLREAALTTMSAEDSQNSKQQRSRSNMRHFMVNNQNFHQARISTKFQSINRRLASFLSPDLMSSEGYDPDQDNSLW